MHRTMANAQALLLVSFSLCVFSLELDTALPHSPPLSAHALPHHHHHYNRHHQSPLHHSPAYPPHHHRYHHHHHSHAPANSPTHNHPRTPAKLRTNHIYTNILTLANPPTRHIYTPAPVQVDPRPPVHPIPTRFVAVEGHVFTKSCSHLGNDTIKGGYPTPGAIVKLECNNRSIVQETVTNRNGYFLIYVVRSITIDTVHTCKVYLVSAPKGLKITDHNGGIRGVTLNPQHRTVHWNYLFTLYRLGSFAFEHICKH